jgi:predicted Zn finger-like uncharacterized protein
MAQDGLPCYKQRHLMKLTCPACSTRYLVDPRAIGAAGRKVRCARCKHVWFATPPEGAIPVGLTRAAPPPPPPPPEETPPPRFQLPAVPPPRRPAWLVAGWAGLAAIVVAAVTALTLFHDSLFIGREAPGAGLDFRNVRAEGERELVIEGEVVNTTLTSRAVPRFKAVVRAAGKELAATRFNVAEKELPPGGTATFRATLPRPSNAAAEVRLQVDQGS